MMILTNSVCDRKYVILKKKREQGVQKNKEILDLLNEEALLKCTVLELAYKYDKKFESTYTHTHMDTNTDHITSAHTCVFRVIRGALIISILAPES